MDPKREQFRPVYISASFRTITNPYKVCAESEYHSWGGRDTFLTATVGVVESEVQFDRRSVVSGSGEAPRA